MVIFPGLGFGAVIVKAKSVKVCLTSTAVSNAYLSQPGSTVLLHLAEGWQLLGCWLQAGLAGMFQPGHL